jgi:membrane-bound transcription factor site-1 protease
MRWTLVVVLLILASRVAGAPTGRGIRVAVFDTGLAGNHTHIPAPKERINWTNERTLDDAVGHGSLVTSIIAGRNEACPGLAPDVELHIMRVFTARHVSYTSWFLDAFNYVLKHRIHIVNLSTGGPDFADQPFIDKIQELAAQGVVVVSAVGNDGPHYGTHNNPADQLEVIGVGALDASGQHVAPFSARGMTLWELNSGGYGRVKPDILAPGDDVLGALAYGDGCRRSSGTSFASPFVAGAVALLAEQNPNWVNPASMKQLLLETADRLPGYHIYEQGAGKMNITRALGVRFQPHISAFPESLNLTDCPYMWPHCDQPLYCSSMPILINVTLLNSREVYAPIVDAVFVPKDGNLLLLEVTLTHGGAIWPWVGWLGVSIQARFPEAAKFDGVVEGSIAVRVDDHPVLKIPLAVRLIPTPPREKRLLWDQHHSLNYPVRYIPRDSLSSGQQLFDMRGDHPHTNFQALYRYVRQQGYFLEVLNDSWLSFQAQNYAALLLVDPEAEISWYETEKLHEDINQRGLSLLVAAEWHHKGMIRKLQFYDENSRQWWFPYTGGCNVGDLNRLLDHFGVELSGWAVLEGQIDSAAKLRYSSGTKITRFPSGGYLLRQLGLSDQYVDGRRTDAAVLGWFSPSTRNSGRLFVMGDSDCLEVGDCLDSVLGPVLGYLTNPSKHPVPFEGLAPLPSDFVEQHNEE